MRITKFLAAAALALSFTAANAQEAEENENGFSVNTDFVSSYAWRGGFCAHASIQPQIEYNAGGFTCGTWATHTLTHDEYNEIDWYAYYGVAGFTFGVSEYCWTGANGFQYFGPYKENHYLEGTISYTLENVPLSFSVNTMLAGANKKYTDKGEEKQAMSTYIGLGYAPTLSNGLDLSLECGLAIEPKDYAMYASKGGFQCVNLAANLSRSFSIKDVASLTLQAGVYCNPKGFEGHGEVGAMAGVGVSF